MAGSYHLSIGAIPFAVAMQNWMSQIIIGIVVTVVGTVIANAIISDKGGRKFFGGGYSHWGPARSGR